jgi:hypothetical protein
MLRAAGVQAIRPETGTAEAVAAGAADCDALMLHLRLHCEPQRRGSTHARCAPKVSLYDYLQSCLSNDHPACCRPISATPDLQQPLPVAAGNDPLHHPSLPPRNRHAIGGHDHEHQITGVFSAPIWKLAPKLAKSPKQGSPAGPCGSAPSRPVWRTSAIGPAPQHKNTSDY